MSSELIEVKCNCGEPREFTLDQLFENPSFKCAKCGIDVHIDASKLQNDIDSATDEAVSGIQKMLNNL